MATDTPKPIHSLILDAGPIIKNEPSVSTLLGQAEALYTIPAVIDEIRDAVTRSRIENTLLPFLTLRSPRPASVKFISDFARKTGDLEVLSRPDIHLMALAYELECERNHGDWRLRNTPGQKGLNGIKPESLKGNEPPKTEWVVRVGEPPKTEGVVRVGEPPKTEGVVRFGEPPETEEVVKEGRQDSEGEKAPSSEARVAWGSAIPSATKAVLMEESATEGLEKKLEQTQLSSPETQDSQRPLTETLPLTSEAPIESVHTPIVKPKPEENPESSYTRSSETLGRQELTAKTPSPVAEVTIESVAQSDPSVEEIEASDSEGSDNEGWITPSNLKKHQEKDAVGSSKPSKAPQRMEVALITSDFAMQNVLLRMNLNLMSPNLQRIRQLKSWVLRCHACFHITKDMTKQFCSRCGKPTLIRTSCSTDKDGNFKVHLKKNMQWNTRGNVYSIPKPVAGTSNGKLVAGGGKGGWGQSLILAEDQKEYIQAMTGARRNKEKDLMDEDYLPNLLSGDRGRAGGRPKVGAGKNVNSKKRR